MAQIFSAFLYEYTQECSDRLYEQELKGIALQNFANAKKNYITMYNYVNDLFFVIRR